MWDDLTTYKIMRRHVWRVVMPENSSLRNLAQTWTNWLNKSCKSQKYLARCYFWYWCTNCWWFFYSSSKLFVSCTISDMESIRIGMSVTWYLANQNQCFTLREVDRLLSGASDCLKLRRGLVLRMWPSCMKILFTIISRLSPYFISTSPLCSSDT